ncbi:MAG: cysteine desulfurase [Dysgonamonadaceae bacterium]|nr:cysteine desulfurase [Dysgonamonadaceae bacterium]MDD4729274.1 cysteine desulfurase [Dysgonamonadaceae bacterium]
MDINKVRDDFPILFRKVYNKPLIYFDNAATTQKPKCVVDKIEEMYYTLNANIHRGVHYLSQQATDEHEAARVTIQKFIGAKSSNEIVFTRGTTESINLIASTYCRAFCQPDDEIIVSTMEHHSNIVPWQLQEEITGVKLRVIPINDKGELIIEEFEKLINPRTKLVSITHISNALGTINDIEEIIKIAHKNDVPVLIDAAQSVQHLPVDVQKLDCDFLVFSAHKVYGPTGIGILYGKEEWLNKLPPYHGGGEMIANVSFEKTTFNDLPYKFEAGTPDFVGSTAMAAAIDYITDIGLDNIVKYEHELLEYATEQLLKIDGLTIYGTSANKSSVVSFLVKDIHHYDMGMLLDKMGIAVRTGHHCAQPLMNRMNVDGTVRASFSFYNTKEEIDQLITGINRVVTMF